MRKLLPVIFDFLLLTIITVPAFYSLLNGQYFTMHDEQHIARLFLLDQGIHQGVLFPRWVSQLGFGYGYPLFNFYPPLIYYLAEFFHIMGFSLIWSIKLVIISGFIFASWGMYLFVKNLTGRLPAFLGATLYTYFFYHAVNSYVRGALAEFFAMSLLPFVLMTLHRLSKETIFKNSLLFGVFFALLILTHPLIALPLLLFLAFAFLFYLIISKKKLLLVKQLLIGFFMALGLSAFFWLPSIFERKFTLVDDILTKNLASYKIHFVCPQQLWYSPWGYGGSISGCFDGMIFQLGKIPIFIVGLAILTSIIFLIKKNRRFDLAYFCFFVFLLAFSIFMTLPYSSLIWDNMSFLWYLQFPWRFFTFIGVFMSLVGSYFIFFLGKKIPGFAFLLTIVLVIVIIIKYSGYFRPQKLTMVTDRQLTTSSEISRRISATSFEFSPKGLRLINTTDSSAPMLWDVMIRGVAAGSYVSNPKMKVRVVIDKAEEKKFQIDNGGVSHFQLNTFNFPGWSAYVDGKIVPIKTYSYLKLISVPVPYGRHEILVRFEDTPVRRIGNWISLLAFSVVLSFVIYKFKKVKS